MGAPGTLTGAESWQNVIQNNRASGRRTRAPRPGGRHPGANRLATKVLP